MNGYIRPILSTILTTDVMPNTDIGNAAEGVVNISEAISKYGIAIVIMAVFFVIFMILIIIMLYSNTRMINTIMNSNAANNKQDQEIISKFVDSTLESQGIGASSNIVDTLTHALDDRIRPIEEALKHGNNGEEKKEDYHKDLVGAYIDINMAFKNISRTTMNQLNCDRIAIYVFHNGNKSMYGLPFFKMSCIHEWTSLGNNTLRGKSHMDMPLHLFNDFIENIHKYGIYKAENINAAKERDPSIEGFTSYSNTKAIYLIAIKNDDGIISGFVSIEFDHIDTFEQDDKRDMDIRCIADNMVSKIAPIVSNPYIFKQNER